MTQKNWFTGAHQDSTGALREGLAVCGPETWVDHLTGCLVMKAEDATLCAAAPDLLEALKKANALVKAAFEHHTGVWKAADDVIDISDAAIAKATGVA